MSGKQMYLTLIKSLIDKLGETEQKFTKTKQELTKTKQELTILENAMKLIGKHPDASVAPVAQSVAAAPVEPAALAKPKPVAPVAQSAAVSATLANFAAAAGLAAAAPAAPTAAPTPVETKGRKGISQLASPQPAATESKGFMEQTSICKTCGGETTRDPNDENRFPDDCAKCTTCPKCKGKKDPRYNHCWDCKQGNEAGLCFSIRYPDGHFCDGSCSFRHVPTVSDYCDTDGCMDFNWKGRLCPRCHKKGIACIYGERCKNVHCEYGHCLACQFRIGVCKKGDECPYAS